MRRIRSGERPAPFGFEQHAFDHLGAHAMRLEVLERRHGAALAQRGDAAQDEEAAAGLAALGWFRVWGLYVVVWLGLVWE